jgi:hypothetical protein
MSHIQKPRAQRVSASMLPAPPMAPSRIEKTPGLKYIAPKNIQWVKGIGLRPNQSGEGRRSEEA